MKSAPKLAPASVCVVAADPLSRAGVIAHLTSPGVTLVDGDAVADGTVVVLVSGTFDEDAERRLDDLRTAAHVAGVLVPVALEDTAFLRAIAAGVRGIVWRRDATRSASGERLPRSRPATAASRTT